jgi:hypothetical protein
MVMSRRLSDRLDRARAESVEGIVLGPEFIGR